MSRVYLAREATFRADGPGTEQWVKHDPKRGIRRESIRPAGLVVIDNFKKSWRLPRSGAPFLEGPSFLTRKDGRRMQDLIKRIKGGRIEAEVVGQDKVAGRSADIVQVSVGRAGTRRKFWVDKETGLRLRTEEVGPDGKVLSGSYYLSLDLAPGFSDADFAPPVGARIEFDDSKRFSSLEDAAKTGIRPRRPGYLPSGFALRVVELGRGGEVVTQRYANGLNVVSLSESRQGVPGHMRRRLGPDGSGFLPMPRGQKAYVWSGDGGRTFYLIGNLSEDELRRIADSVK